LVFENGKPKFNAETLFSDLEGRGKIIQNEKHQPNSFDVQKSIN